MLPDGFFHRDVPGLLVSVRCAAEASAALAGGADVIDVKEPNRGPLGAADSETIARIVQCVGRRVPVTAAAGELTDFVPTTRMPPGVSLVKLGLAGCGHRRDWTRRWRQAIDTSRQGVDSTDTRPVAVVYADWRTAAAPHPDEISSAAVDIQCPVLLIDTWNKSAGTLFDHWLATELQVFVNQIRTRGMAVVLAGSLSERNLLAAAKLRPDFIAVRGAACDAGRNGTVSRERVNALRQRLADLAMSSQT